MSKLKPSAKDICVVYRFNSKATGLNLGGHGRNFQRYSKIISVMTLIEISISILKILKNSWTFRVTELELPPVGHFPGPEESGSARWPWCHHRPREGAQHRLCGIAEVVFWGAAWGEIHKDDFGEFRVVQSFRCHVYIMFPLKIELHS